MARRTRTARAGRIRPRVARLARMRRDLGTFLRLGAARPGGARSAAPSWRAGSSLAVLIAQLVAAGAARPAAARRPRRAARQTRAGAAAGRRTARRSPAAARAAEPSGPGRAALTRGSGPRRSAAARPRRALGSARWPSCSGSPRDLAGEAEPLEPRDLLLAVAAAPGRRAAAPRISLRMRLRSWSAKCGVEAPMSWRTSSTVTWRLGAQALGLLGFGHARDLRALRLSTGWISSSVSMRAWTSTEIAFSSPMIQPWL